MRALLSKRIAQPDEVEPITLDSNGHIAFSPDDPKNPKNWSKGRRWLITVAVILLSLNATMASSAPSGALESISESFHVSSVASALVTTLFLCGYAFGPLLWAPMSEFFGRQPVLYICFTGYMAFLFLNAFPPNFGGLLVGRFFSSMFVSGVISNTPGVLVDLWDDLERGEAIALFATMLFIGPALGPVIAGFLQLKENFRWAFYVLLWAGALPELLMFTVPETLPAKLLTRKARQVRLAKCPGYENVQSPFEASGHSLVGIFRVALTRPWIILFDPISLFAALYMSVIYMLLYMLFTIYPIVFQEKRGWNSGVGELPLLGTVVGAAVGGLICYWDCLRADKRIKAGHRPKAEDRLVIAMLAAVLFPISMFWFAWTGQFNTVPWIVPTIAGGFVACVIALCFMAYINYITDSYLMYASSANAANTIARSLCAAAAPLFDSQMFHALGIGGGGSLIGGIACLLAPVPFIFYFYGESIRIKSRFAPTTSLEESAGSSRATEARLEAGQEQARESGDTGAHNELPDNSSDEGEKTLEE